MSSSTRPSDILCAGSREAVDGRATVPQRGVPDTHRSASDDNDGVVMHHDHDDGDYDYDDDDDDSSDGGGGDDGVMMHHDDGCGNDGDD